MSENAVETGPAIKVIVKDDDPILREISTPVTEFDVSLEELVGDMFGAMVSNQGIGLSAVQIGVTKRVIMAYNHDDRNIHVLVNPVFVRKLNRETIEREGCLSIPGFTRKVSRPAKCELKFQDLSGNEHVRNYSGMLARVIQHEMDHLDGILIKDKPLI